MDNTQKNINAYEEMKQDLEAQYMGKWIVIHDTKLISVYENFELAAEEAVKKFGEGPYLIRQVGATQVSLPASVVYCM